MGVVDRVIFVSGSSSSEGEEEGKAERAWTQPRAAIVSLSVPSRSARRLGSNQK
jgi:hypothetical protein